jgi:hypothetical protein
VRVPGCRSLRAGCALLVLAVLYTGCVLDGSEGATQSSLPSSMAFDSTVVLHRTIRLPLHHLPRSSRLPIPDPRLYQLTVTARSARRVLVRVWAVTEGGTLLRLFHGSERDDCSVVAQERVCVAQIPSLEAQGPGVWRIVARDESRFGGATRLEFRFSLVR